MSVSLWSMHRLNKSSMPTNCCPYFSFLPFNRLLHWFGSQGHLCRARADHHQQLINYAWHATNFYSCRSGWKLDDELFEDDQRSHFSVRAITTDWLPGHVLCWLFLNTWGIRGKQKHQHPLLSTHGEVCWNTSGQNRTYIKSTNSSTDRA